jgi:hypothetical protein
LPNKINKVLLKKHFCNYKLCPARRPEMPEKQSKFARRKELIVKELLAAMLLTLILLGLALLFPIGYAPPLPEGPGVGEITAPWLIIWLQVLLRHLPLFLAGLLIPLGVVLLLAVLPWLPGAGQPDSRYHFGLHLAMLLAVGCALALLTFWGR